ncbi:hypothetical protein OH77DRAFT_595520 [Trametes cingulata]|nr:hypothetical protein OH77DRAFT_595520 [Trametes cingulata]
MLGRRAAGPFCTCLLTVRHEVIPCVLPPYSPRSHAHDPISIPLTLTLTLPASLSPPADPPTSHLPAIPPSAGRAYPLCYPLHPPRAHPHPTCDTSPSRFPHFFYPPGTLCISIITSAACSARITLTTPVMIMTCRIL